MRIGGGAGWKSWNVVTAFLFSVLGEKYGEVSENVTSAEIKYLLVEGSKYLYLFCRQEYPRKTHFEGLVLNFIFFFRGKAMNKVQLKEITLHILSSFRFIAGLRTTRTGELSSQETTLHTIPKEISRRNCN